MRDIPSLTPGVSFTRRCPFRVPRLSSLTLACGGGTREQSPLVSCAEGIVDECLRYSRQGAHPPLVAESRICIARGLRKATLGRPVRDTFPVKPLLITVAIAAMLCTVFATVTAVVFCLSMGANASDAEIRSLKLWMLGLSLVGVGGIGTGIYLLRAGQLGWSIGASFSPTLIFFAILVIVLARK